MLIDKLKEAIAAAEDNQNAKVVLNALIGSIYAGKDRTLAKFVAILVSDILLPEAERNAELTQSTKN